MSKDLIKDLKELLRNFKLSNYEINAYITLLNSKSLTAREIIKKSSVPRGRIYNILDNLRTKGTIEIQESRPKMYRPLPLNLALNNLISYIEDLNQKMIMSLYNQAKRIESNLYNSNSLIDLISSRLFWSTAYGTHSIESLYIRKFTELKEELILTGFLNRNTIKILPLTAKAHQGVLNSLNRGVKVYYLWCFEDNEKDFVEKLNIKLKKLANELIEIFKDKFDLSTQIEGFELKFTHKKIPSYYDIFDKKSIIFKLQNPLNPWNIFACMNVLDPNLAENLRKNFFDLWLFESFENFNYL
ncbi:MAG: TrmB family transcriptional regulator [Promethearchaeota archaeon]